MGQESGENFFLGIEKHLYEKHMTALILFDFIMASIAVQGVGMNVPRPHAADNDFIHDLISDKLFHTFVDVCSCMEEAQRSRRS